MRVGIYPGSFDPVTNGHIDIIDRASRILDKLIVGVFDNINKTPLFCVEERMRFIKSSCNYLNNVEIERFNGLLIDFVKDKKATTIIKGLRDVMDFEYELQMSLMNKKLSKEIDTLFLAADSKYIYLSSSIVKETGIYGGCIKELIPAVIEKEVTEMLVNYNK